jgi:ABC-type nitrate/sulfonate/bicarbonate transport system substrate-binding protein
MNVKSRPILKCAATLLTAMALSATIVASSQAENTKVRVGATVSIDASSAAFCLALDNGTFAKAGLDIDLKTFVQSNQKYDIFKAGGLDFDVNMGAINAAQLYSGGVPIVVLRAVVPADIWAVIARKDSTLTKPSDFKGKKFGVVSLSGINYGSTYLAFKAQNVEMMKDVKVSTLPPAGLITALENGDIDGATTYEPFLTPALKTGRVKLLFRPGDIYAQKFHEPFIALTLATRKEYLDKNRAALAKIVAIMEDTMASLPQHTDEAAKAILNHMPEMKMTQSDAKELLDRYVPGAIKSQNTPTFIKSVQNLYDRLLEAKQLQEPVKAADFWIKL